MLAFTLSHHIMSPVRLSLLKNRPERSARLSAMKVSQHFETTKCSLGVIFCEHIFLTNFIISFGAVAQCFQAHFKQLAV